jgi:isopentenyl-diphosphate delta-isomerase
VTTNDDSKFEEDGDKEVRIREVIRRKEEGIDVPLTEKVDAREATTLLECVHLIHNALPEVDMGDLDLTTDFLGKELLAPIIVDSMTGGAPRAEEINGTLAEVAETMGFAMGVGSQRAGLLSKEMGRTYSIVRKKAPTAFIFANIGGAQLAKGLTTADAEKLVEMIDADALAVHLNPLQEVVQPEGEPAFKGVLEKIHDLCRDISVPVIVKEVGAGLSGEVAVRLERAGAKALNVSGAGGTSWAGVEAIRARLRKMETKARLGTLLWDWGIPTAAALIDVRKAVAVQVVASGGLRNGLEIAKCLSLGADACGIARPMLEHASMGKEDLEQFAGQLLQELRAVMFITGSGTVADLRKVRKVITPPLNYWVS